MLLLHTAFHHIGYRFILFLLSHLLGFRLLSSRSKTAYSLGNVGMELSDALAVISTALINKFSITFVNGFYGQPKIPPFASGCCVFGYLAEIKGDGIECPNLHKPMHAAVIICGAMDVDARSLLRVLLEGVPFEGYEILLEIHAIRI